MKPSLTKPSLTASFSSDLRRERSYFLPSCPSATTCRSRWLYNAFQTGGADYDKGVRGPQMALPIPAPGSVQVLGGGQVDPRNCSVGSTVRLLSSQQGYFQFCLSDRLYFFLLLKLMRLKSFRMIPRSCLEPNTQSGGFSWGLALTGSQLPDADWHKQLRTIITGENICCMRTRKDTFIHHQDLAFL